MDEWINKKCPFCGHKKIYQFHDRKRLRCVLCKRDFRRQTTTRFHYSKLPIEILKLAEKEGVGISSIKLAAVLGVAQVTAWKIQHRLGKVSHFKGYVPNCSVKRCARKRKFKGYLKNQRRLYSKTCRYHKMSDVVKI